MKDLELGLLFYPHHDIGSPPQDLVEAAVKHARLAESLGFDQLWTGHHYLTDDQTLQPVPLLARLAAETNRLRLGAWFHFALTNPVDMAEQLATLDAICDGRLICGAVMGYRDVEFENFGVPKSERVSRFEDSIEILKRIWTEDGVTFQGRHFALENATIHPKPVQDPRPLIWMGGNSVPAVRRAARLGDAWAIGPYEEFDTVRDQLMNYNDELRKVGRDPSEVQRPMLRDVLIARDTKTAFEQAKQFIAPFYETYAKWGKEEAIGRPGEFSKPFEELSKGRFIIGDPEHFVREIRRYHNDLGIDSLILQINRPGMPTDVVLEGTRLLGEEVLPHLR
jgi:alkanesulfonate monooxygenase SsuD/methylene tetrahydromethanopterin reductase-like flavin-dependent oxidoreductase (luciferase family)